MNFKHQELRHSDIRSPIAILCNPQDLDRKRLPCTQIVRDGSLSVDRETVVDS